MNCSRYVSKNFGSQPDQLGLDDGPNINIFS